MGDELRAEEINLEGPVDVWEVNAIEDDGVIRAVPWPKEEPMSAP